MFSTAEPQWRTRVIKIMLWILLVIVVVLVLIWFWLTQPLLSRPQPNGVRTVDPARLEAHVRKLSIEFSPRDIGHLENYWHEGYNAVMITDTAFYRNRNYHTANDTAEKLDYKRMAMVVEGVYAAVNDLAK